MRIARITKSEAARALGINRRTVIRYAQAGLITEDSSGRVLRSQVLKVLGEQSRRGVRAMNRRPEFRLIHTANGWTSGYRLAKAKMRLSDIRLILWDLKQPIEDQNGKVIMRGLSRGSRRKFVFSRLYEAGRAFYEEYLSAKRSKKAVRRY